MWRKMVQTVVVQDRVRDVREKHWRIRLILSIILDTILKKLKAEPE